MNYLAKKTCKRLWKNNFPMDEKDIDININKLREQIFVNYLCRPGWNSYLLIGFDRTLSIGPLPSKPDRVSQKMIGSTLSDLDLPDRQS